MDSSLPAGTAPLYAKIADDLRDKIRDGFYGPGALLPSRNEIAASLRGLGDHRPGCPGGAQPGGLRPGHPRPRAHRPPQAPPPHRALPAVRRQRRARLRWIRRCWKCRTWRCTRRPHRTTSRCPWNRAPISVWVRRAVYASVVDHQAIQIHVSWLAGLGDDAGAALRTLDPGMAWPDAVQQVTGRTIATVLQNTRARGANPFEAATFAIPDAATVLVSHLTTYDAGHRPVEHSRFAWPTDAVRISAEYSYPAGADVEPQ